MNTRSVYFKVISACIISVLPVTAAFSNALTGDAPQHNGLRPVSTNISEKKVSRVVKIKQAVPGKGESEKGIARNSQFILPLIFEKNVGQIDDNFDFLLRQQNYAMYFTGNSFITEIANHPVDGSSSKDIENKPSLLKMSLVKSQDQKAEGVRRVKTRINQYIGADEKKWLTDIPGYAELHYKNVYKGIDMIWKSKGRIPEYQFNIEGNTSEESIRIKFNSSALLSIDKNNLTITFENGVVYHSKPQFFEEISGRRKPLKGHYVVRDKNEIGFKVLNRTPGKKLVIDPSVFVTTRSVRATNPLIDAFLPRIKRGFDIESFGSSVFVAGTTMKVPDGREYLGRNDSNSFIIKMQVPSAPFSPFPPQPDNGREIPNPSYITYIGGTKFELNTVISLGEKGEIYVGGTTESDDFPTPGETFRNSPSLTGNTSFDRQAFVGKLSGNGELLLGTMIGAASEHNINDIKFSGGSVYVAGVAEEKSNNAGIRSDATDAAWRNEVKGRSDGFVAKLKADLSSLEYFTYLGSDSIQSTLSGEDSIYGLDVVNGKAYLAGTTASDLFPTTDNASQRSFSFPDSSNSCEDELLMACYDGFVTVLNETGSAIEYSTYYGGPLVDIVNDISADNVGSVAITGTKRGGFDQLVVDEIPQHIFVAKITPFIGGPFVFNRQFNLPLDEKGDGVGNAISIDPSGSIHVTGEVSRNGLAVGNSNIDNLARSAVLGESDMFYMFIPSTSTNGVLVYSLTLVAKAGISDKGLLLDKTQLLRNSVL